MPEFRFKEIKSFVAAGLRDFSVSRIKEKMPWGVPVPEDDLPPLPKPNKQGHYPAIESTRVSIARDLIRERKALGLSQSELATKAAVRQETISRIESGKHSVTVRTYDKIFNALERARSRTAK